MKTRALALSALAAGCGTVLIWALWALMRTPLHGPLVPKEPAPSPEVPRPPAPEPTPQPSEWPPVSPIRPPDPDPRPLPIVEEPGPQDEQAARSTKGRPKNGRNHHR